MPRIILAIIISYLLGSIPTAYIFGRLIKGIDIRNFGSGNVGATNALRVLGKGAGLMVLSLDILKGLLSVILLGELIGLKTTVIREENLLIILGLSCILGHNWTVFLRFKGGKGVATTLGVLFGLALKISGLKVVLGSVILTWCVVFLLFRIVSLASILSAIGLPVYMIAFRQSTTLIYLSIILSVLLILRHKSNLKRILKGQEKVINLTPPRKKRQNSLRQFWRTWRD